MSTAALAAKCYPFALALANIGAGVGLYHVGLLLFAALLWTGGALVVTAMLSSVASRRLPAGRWLVPGNGADSTTRSR